MKVRLSRIVPQTILTPEIMEATFEIPEPVAKRLGYGREALPRRALEALLVDECSRGRLSRGKVAEILGLSFHEAEALFRQGRVPYPIKTSADDTFENGSLPKVGGVLRFRFQVFR